MRKISNDDKLYFDMCNKARVVNKQNKDEQMFKLRSDLKKAYKEVEEIKKTDQLIFEATGGKSLFFRPPFGITNPNIHRAVQKTEHNIIGWSIRSLDTATEKEDKILKRIERKLHPGGIILMHDTTQKSVNVLENLLKSLSEKKYKVIPVDELLSLKAYRE